MGFPRTRLRRMRATEACRRMVRETTLSVDDLVYPLFVVHGRDVKHPIPSMPGVFQLSIDRLVEEATEVKELGIPGIILFGIPGHKDEMGSEAYAEDGIVQQAVQAIKERVPDLIVITDVCLCEYTSHGHCGVVKDGRVLNDPTVELLAKEAISHVRAGADIVAPSDMMDGRVGVIRDALDREGFEHIPILSYGAKYASALYAPFREAAESTPLFGDRRSYQMDPANSREAIREIEMDIEEGADMVMVKPALSYLDIIYQIRSKWSIPVAAYNVSGEYSMIKAAAKMGWVDENRLVMEMLLCIKRAGASIILTYFARDVARILQRGER